MIDLQRPLCMPHTLRPHECMTSAFVAALRSDVHALIQTCTQSLVPSSIAVMSATSCSINYHTIAFACVDANLRVRMCALKLRHIYNTSSIFICLACTASNHDVRYGSCCHNAAMPRARAGNHAARTQACRAKFNNTSSLTSMLICC